jgi:CheY-like chemotaxis protein
LLVLVVDDDADARELLVTILKQCKAEVAVASSADDAIKILDQLEPNVIISDVEMPREDGYGFIRRVRALEDGRKRKIPAAALTAHARVEDRQRALFAGFQTHIAKPVEPAELVAVIASLTGRTRGC